MKLRPLHRLWKLHAVRHFARAVGRLDEQRQLGSFGSALLKAARQQAARAGCVRDDVDNATIDGLLLGRKKQGK